MIELKKLEVGRGRYRYGRTKVEESNASEIGTWAEW